MVPTGPTTDFLKVWPEASDELPIITFSFRRVDVDYAKDRVERSVDQTNQRYLSQIEAERKAATDEEAARAKGLAERQRELDSD
jgi:hypothetical protein